MVFFGGGGEDKSKTLGGLAIGSVFFERFTFFFPKFGFLFFFFLGLNWQNPKRLLGS